jgi:hypothetical protein
MNPVVPSSAKPRRRYKRKADTRIQISDGDNKYYGCISIYGLQPPEVEARLLLMRRANGSADGTDPADVPPG